MMKCSECVYFESWKNGFGCCLLMDGIFKRDERRECEDDFTKMYAVKRADGPLYNIVMSDTKNVSQGEEI